LLLEGEEDARLPQSEQTTVMCVLFQEKKRAEEAKEAETTKLNGPLVE
jgi:hypothetical protein